MLRPLLFGLVCAGTAHGLEPEEIQKVDVGGLQAALSEGGAEGLSRMLTAMSSMQKNDEKLIPTKTDDDGTPMYDFTAILGGAPAEDKEDNSKATLEHKADPTKAANMVDMVIHKNEAAEASVETTAAPAQKNLRGGEQPTAAPKPEGTAAASTTQAAPVLTAAPLVAAAVQPVVNAAPVVAAPVQMVAQAATATQSSGNAEALQQGLASVRDSIDKMMRQTQAMASGASKADQAIKQEAATSDTVGAILKRVDALEADHKQLSTQVKTQNDELKSLEEQVKTDKQRMSNVIAENQKLEAAESAANHQLAAVSKLNGVLAAGEKAEATKLQVMEKDNKDLTANVLSLKQELAKMRVVRKVHRKRVATTTTTTQPPVLTKEDQDQDDDDEKDD
eukprot:TRINITY_DN11114_c0_g1_i1.p1 TRINITY_DN11114_c0_g1~~TRINITY_DN11114_c0_g1_i1.p1  ORF type:complete len:392 (-),score=137.05 TRINITY_DN11114_c0_g1_i1:88-1263(-)